MMQTTEIRVGEITPARCGCEVVGGRAVYRCEEGEFLRALMLDARDAVRGGEEARRLRLPGARSGAKARLDRFATTRDEYHRHVRGEAF